MKTALSQLCLVATLTLVGLANAQPPDTDRAASHFEQGVELYHDGSLDAALVEFSRAYELMPDYRLLYNLAQVQTERRQYVIAIELFERYLAEGQGEIPPERQGQVAAELVSLRKRVADVFVEANVVGAELFINDVSFGKLPIAKAAPVNAGVCKVRLEKAGYLPLTQTITVAGGEHPRLVLQLQPQPQAGTSGRPGALPDTRPRRVVRPVRTPFWLSLAATGVLAAGAGTFAVLTTRADEKLGQELDKIPADKDRLAKQRDKVGTFAAVADGLGAGAVVAGVVAIYFLVDPPMRFEREQETGVASIGLVPSPGGAALGGRF